MVRLGLGLELWLPPPRKYMSTWVRVRARVRGRVTVGVRVRLGLG